MLKLLVCLVLTLLSSTANPIGNKEIIINDEEIAPEKTASELAISKLNLPSNATSIRADITDSGFTCENKSYGYYADIENDCQIFHVCLPVTYADGKSSLFRWSFICPEETIFSQDSFTCMRAEDMLISCEESAQYFDLNGNFGMPEQAEASEMSATEKVIQEIAPAEDIPKPATPEISKPTALENKKPTKHVVNRRKPINNKFQSTSSNIKNIVEVLPVQDTNTLLNEQIKDDVPAKQENSRTDTKITEQPAFEETLDTKIEKPNESIALHDNSAETDVLSALIESLTNDSEPTNYGASAVEVEKVNNVLNSSTKTEDGQKEKLDGEEVTKTIPITTNSMVETDQNIRITTPATALSIDDIVDLVKDSLDKESESSDFHGTLEQIKPIYQRKEDKDSNIILITKPNEENKLLAEESTDSNIIPVEIIEPNSENSDFIKTKSRRHLNLSFGKK